MKEILLKNGKVVIENKGDNLYDCKHYEYYTVVNDYKLICIDENCTKEYVEETYNITL